MAIDEKFKSHFISYATVMHKRLTPKINQFIYEAFYICFDISKIYNLTTKIFSVNKFNLYSFYEKDHGPKNGSNIKDWANETFKNSGMNNSIDKIFLFTHPRILGYCFNPVSFWLALNDQQKLIAVIAQVNNTFNESHSYVIFNKNGHEIESNQWFEADKEFHVSPFYKTEGNYKFRFIFEQNQIAIWINYLIGEKTLLTSVISKKNINYDNKNLIISFIKMPFITFKVIALIHWQALKIFFKKIKYISKPKPPQNQITINR
jgi:DUF1365 family protein